MDVLSRYQLWHGREEAPADECTLAAGPLTVRLDGCDLRYLRAGNLELLRRLYAAVRDHNWNTIPGETTNVRREIGHDHFAIRFETCHRHHAVDFSWQGEITGSADGTITYTMAGVAARAFRYNRIGFCVLHPPATAAGRPYRGITPDGPISGELPALIGPQVVVDGVYPGGLFPAVSSLTIGASDEVSVRFDFEGDLFEMEDQRNWTDASFKTYCTPLALPWPKEAQPGLRFRQRVTISVEDRRGRQRRPATKRDEAVRIALGQGIAESLPRIGFGSASHGQALSARETELLRRLRPAHLRVDVAMRDTDCARRLQLARDQAAALGCGLEVAVFLTSPEEELGRLAGLLSEGDPIVRVVAFAEGKEATPPGLVPLVRERLRAVAPRAQYAGGTNASFCELNRNRPGVPEWEAVTYAITPQIHAFDDTSLVETLEGQFETVRTARSFCQGRPIAVGPVTLKPRFNAVATGPEEQVGPGELPPEVDPRQVSLLGAGWTAGSIASLTRGGAGSLTYYETTGWRGLIASEAAPTPPGAFPPVSGFVFPLYHVFADLAEWPDEEVVEVETSNPLAVQGLAVRGRGGTHLLLANLTARPRRVVVTPVRETPCRRRRLHEGTAPIAMADPEGFRSQWEPESLGGRELVLNLMPYEVARLDWLP
jgi:hypothetical protein